MAGIGHLQQLDLQILKLPRHQLAGIDNSIDFLDTAPQQIPGRVGFGSRS